MKKINQKQIFFGWATAAMLFLGGTSHAQKWNLETAGFVNHQDFTKGMTSEGYSLGIGYRQYLNEQWSVGLNVAFSQSRFSYIGHPKGGSYNVTDMEEDPFEFRYAVNFYLESDKWNSLRVPLTVQYETKGDTRWYIETGVLANLMLGAGKSRSILGNMRTSGYYPQWDAELKGPKYAGFGEFGYIERKRDVAFENTFAWVLESGVKWMIHKKQSQSIYLGAFLNVGINSLRQKSGDYGRLVEYTNNIEMPIDYRNIWSQEELKDKKLQDYVFGIRFGYGFGGK